MRADAVWVGPGAYTTGNPTHSTVTSTDPLDQEWSGAEAVFHELSHILVPGLSAKLNARLGGAARQNGELWHAVQFYLTGEVVREVLASRSIDYNPVVYSVKSLFPTVWSSYRKPIEEAWEPYLEGRYSMDEAITKTVNAVAPPK